MRKTIAILFSALFLNGVAHAGWGVSFMAGQLSTSVLRTRNLEM